MRFFSLFLVSFISTSLHAGGSESRVCNSGDFQACKSCKTLAQAVADADPNEGEYFHGAQWNGLYAAYVHDCKAVAEDLLRRGANPNWGGTFGSMIISVTDKWPHNKKTVNQSWAALLLKYGASRRKTVPEQGKIPEELLKEYESTPDYPDIWSRFQR